jgi:putative transposase
MLFIIELATRRIQIAGTTSEPDAAWMGQMSRNLTDASDGFLTGKRFLIHDRDPLFTLAFRETLAAAGVQVVRLPPRSPESQCVRGAVRSHHQGFLSGPDDSRR